MSKNNKQINRVNLPGGARGVGGVHECEACERGQLRQGLERGLVAHASQVQGQGGEGGEGGGQGLDAQQQRATFRHRGGPHVGVGGRQRVQRLAALGLLGQRRGPPAGWL